MGWATLVLGGLGGALGLWALLELAVRRVAARPCRVGFYGSVARDEVRALQAEVGLRTARGPGWVHLGWIADPARERYRVERRAEGGWRPCGEARFGSFLAARGGTFRVLARPRGGGSARVVGAAEVEPEEGSPPLFVPRIAGPWRPLFRPRRHGRYVNDHCLYRDARGDWRLLGITSETDGDFAAERRFAAGVSRHFPPEGEMREDPPVADFGELAWAPHVVRASDGWHLFWSPHVLHQMRSDDGIAWHDHRVVLRETRHPFFRDPMLLEVAPGQWLLYTTARGRWFSCVDVYQSFDLRRWQYIRTALRTGPGSERNSPFASTESPTVATHRGRYYLSVTYNNDSWFWPGLLLLRKRWPNPASYNDTLVFHSACPYDFGCYRGRRRAPTLVARLEAHAPEWVEHPDTGEWWITTAGWPWVASLTSGEVAVAPLGWQGPIEPGP